MKLSRGHFLRLKNMGGGNKDLGDVVKNILRQQQKKNSGDTVEKKKGDVMDKIWGTIRKHHFAAECEIAKLRFSTSKSGKGFIFPIGLGMSH